MSMVKIAPGVTVPDNALEWKFVRASGPGGQNVNKVSTAVELRFKLDAAQLPGAVRKRLETLAGARLTSANEIVIFAQTQRSQARNREDALARLAGLIVRARKAPKRRIATEPSRAAKARRVDVKKRRGAIKRSRGKPDLT